MKKLVSLLLALALVLSCTFAMAESVADLAKAAESMTHEELLEKALANGGVDNTTIILCEVQ